MDSEQQYAMIIARRKNLWKNCVDSWQHVQKHVRTYDKIARGHTSRGHQGHPSPRVSKSTKQSVKYKVAKTFTLNNLQQ